MINIFSLKMADAYFPETLKCGLPLLKKDTHTEAFYKCFTTGFVTAHNASNVTQNDGHYYCEVPSEFVISVGANIKTGNSIARVVGIRKLDANRNELKCLGAVEAGAITVCGMGFTPIELNDFDFTVQSISGIQYKIDFSLLRESNTVLQGKNVAIIRLFVNGNATSIPLSNSTRNATTVAGDNAMTRFIFRSFVSNGEWLWFMGNAGCITEPTTGVREANMMLFHSYFYFGKHAYDNSVVAPMYGANWTGQNALNSYLTQQINGQMTVWNPDNSSWSVPNGKFSKGFMSYDIANDTWGYGFVADHANNAGMYQIFLPVAVSSFNTLTSIAQPYGYGANYGDVYINNTGNRPMSASIYGHLKLAGLKLPQTYSIGVTDSLVYDFKGKMYWQAESTSTTTMLFSLHDSDWGTTL